MSHRFLEGISDSLERAVGQTENLQVSREFSEAPFELDGELIQRVAGVLELAVLDLVFDGYEYDEESHEELKYAAATAFRLLRVLPRPDDGLQAGMFSLRAAALAVLGDKGVDAARWLREDEWPALPVDSRDWRERTWATVLDVWLRLIRKKGWEDRDLVLERIAGLRDDQAIFEKTYLDGMEIANAKASALELIGLYHLSKAAEIFAYYMTDGAVEGNHQIHELLDMHFDRAVSVSGRARMVDLDPLSRLLAATASQMAENSVWTVTRAVNSRVTDFVKNLVSKGRGDKAVFDVLPPQRQVLAERGLLGSSRRAVVVSLPTSSGKTMIAEFRILQALNQFEREEGWVAYLAPTRALVNQISRQLRRDMSPLGINVERISPALEIDSVESELLRQEEPEAQFRVLVSTPEKLDLLLRQGWEEKIGRPLTLVIVDEAHNIQSAERGLKLELLLATINNECKYAQFLLLTPFINNAREVARWLGGRKSEDMSLSLDWQPNDRVIGIVRAEKTEPVKGRSHDYRLVMETVHTTRKTLTADKTLDLPNNREIAPTYSKALSKAATLAAVAAQGLQKRGPVIVMHSRPDRVWALAGQLEIEVNKKEKLTPEISLVQEFLELEMGGEFPLIGLLSHGVGVHHGGLSDEVRVLMEWLFEKEQLRFLVATTTIAQGVNFPVSGVVMASHQYPYGVDMPPEDFWNIAGRAGRISQEFLGVVALVAKDGDKADRLRKFINRQSGDLNSALIELVTQAGELSKDLGRVVNERPQWSAFVQYLAHTYRQMGRPEDFADEIERVLRNTFGFQKLRDKDPSLAGFLLEGVHSYTEYLQEPGQPIKLVDSTGFSLNSIKKVLGAASSEGINRDTWNAESLFDGGNGDLQNMMGVLLGVPELRENLEAVTGGRSPDGNKLARIVKDWVNGCSVTDIARSYFMKKEGDEINALTRCGQNLFGRLIQTAAWGLGALISITGSEMEEDEMEKIVNLPSCVYYGVNDDNAIALRLLGVPRTAAVSLADSIDDDIFEEPLPGVRKHLSGMDEMSWQRALGQNEGKTYREVWRVLEGLNTG